MAALPGSSSKVPSMPPPRPKSPPQYPDLSGKRREMAKLQTAVREIGVLEEELRLADNLQPASKCSKEVTDFVVAKSDPLIPPTNREKRKTCCFWKWLCGTSCSDCSSICCSCHSECSVRVEMPQCCDSPRNPCACCSRSCCSCFSCPKPKCGCHCCPLSWCCKETSCCASCCTPQCPSCLDCSCCQWKCSRPKCPKAKCSYCNPFNFCY